MKIFYASLLSTCISISTFGSSDVGKIYQLTSELATNIAISVSAGEKTDVDSSNKYYGVEFPIGIDPTTGQEYQFETNLPLAIIGWSSEDSISAKCLVQDNIGCSEKIRAYNDRKDKMEKCVKKNSESAQRITGGYIMVNGRQVECTGIDFSVSRDAGARESFYIYAEYDIEGDTACLKKGNVIPDYTFSKTKAVAPVFYYENGKIKNDFVSKPQPLFYQ